MSDRPIVKLLEGTADRPRRWRVDWPDGSALLVRRADTPLRLKVSALTPQGKPLAWVEIPNDGRIPSPDIFDTSD